MLVYGQAVTKKEKEEVYRIRYRVYGEEKGWIDPSGYPKGLERDEYDRRSVHFLARDETSRGVGTLRLIRGSATRLLPVEKSFSIDIPRSRNSGWAEASRLAVLAEMRGERAELGLFRYAFAWSLEHGIDRVYAVVEKKLLRLLQRTGLPFHELAEPKYHFGAYTLPVCLMLQEASVFVQDYQQTRVKELQIR